MAMTGGTAKLVKSVTPYSDWPDPVSLYIYYKVVSQSTTNNTTLLHLGMYVTTPDAYPIGEWSDWNGSYLGTATSGANCKTFDGTIPYFDGVHWIAENIPITVTHNADGTKTAAIYWKWGVVSDAAYGYTSNAGSFTVALPTIPRSSTVSVGTAIAGKSVTISVSRASSAFTHTLRYVIGAASGTIATGVTTSATWEVPYSLLSEFPSAVTGVGTIYCDTYNGSTKLGTSSATLTVVAPDNEVTRPTAAMTLSAVSDLAVDAYVTGKSKVQAAFVASSEYSTIASYSLTVNNTTTSGNPALSGVLGASGDVVVTGVVTDARGFSTTLTETISVISYNLPRVVPMPGYNAVICERGLSSGESSGSGLYLVVRAARSYSPVTVNGEQTNFCTLRMRHKTSSADTWGAWTTLIDSQNLDSDTYYASLPDIVSSSTTSYNVQIGVVDTIGGEWTQDFFIPTEYVAFHIKDGGRGASFFGFSERDGELTVNGDLHVTGNPIGILERVYPVGAVYMSMSETDPATLFGFGTWERIMDKFLLAAGNTYAAGDTGGEDQHTLTVAEMPSHTHTLNITTDGALASTEYFKATANQGGTYYQPKTGATGNSAPHNNMPPYLAVYVWQRTQ